MLNSKKAVSIAGYITMGLGAVLSIVSGIIGEKQVDLTIEEKVAEAVAKSLNKD